jgi:hypothetical protein
LEVCPLLNESRMSFCLLLKQCSLSLDPCGHCSFSMT